MSSPQRPEIARPFRDLDRVRAFLDEQVDRMHSESFVATDETGTVEVAVNGVYRLVDLRFDARVLNLGAQEVTARINEAIYAATQFAHECCVAEVEDLKTTVAEALTRIQEQSPFS